MALNDDGEPVATRFVPDATKLAEGFEQFLTAYEWFKGRECAIHFRYRTHGATDLENCHPYPLGEDKWFMHNGIIPIGPKTSKFSDTYHYGKLIAPMADTGWLRNENFQLLVERDIGQGNKFVFLDKEGILIYNRESGVDYAGCWFSNEYAWEPPRKHRSRHLLNLVGADTVDHNVWDDESWQFYMANSNVDANPGAVGGTKRKRTKTYERGRGAVREAFSDERSREIFLTDGRRAHVNPMGDIVAVGDTASRPALLALPDNKGVVRSSPMFMTETEREDMGFKCRQCGHDHLRKAYVCEQCHAIIFTKEELEKAGRPSISAEVEAAAKRLQAVVESESSCDDDNLEHLTEEEQSQLLMVQEDEGFDDAQFGVPVIPKTLEAWSKLGLSQMRVLAMEEPEMFAEAMHDLLQSPVLS